MDHPRLGLIGCLAYWPRGSMAHAATMIAALCVKLGISERVRGALPETTATREAGGWNKLLEKFQLDTPQLGRLQGYPVLQRPASCRGRSVAQPNEGRCLGSHF